MDIESDRTASDRTASDRTAIAWLARRVGFGLDADMLATGLERGVPAVLDLLLDPDAAGLGPAINPWADIELALDSDGNRQQIVQAMLQAWFDHVTTTDRPLEEWMVFFWHDHFAVSAQVVNFPRAIDQHFTTLRTHALGNFRELLRAIATDPAMLIFLDGNTSTGRSPNENFGRELLELYSVGLGAQDDPNYTEDDVRSASIALTGWRIVQGTGEVRFVAARHDDTPQTLLGVDGVHDLDTTIDAILADPACASFIAAKVARAILGPGYNASLIEGFAETFRSGDYEIRPLLRAVIEAGLNGAAQPAVQQPALWMAQAIKVTGASLRARQAFPLLSAMGQIPMAPPNVGGFPGPGAYLSASSTAARFTLAAEIAAQTSLNNPTRVAARSGDFDTLADLLARPEGLSATTLEAVAALPASAGPEGAAELALVLASPDLMTV